MFELTRHIESLLLRNDCVIVPHLGGFVTSFRPARWVREENLFLPPTRSVGFNAHLTINDGLLTQSYMQAADVSYPDAQRLVERDVEHVKDVLLREGEFTFDGIGKLLQRLDGHYDFIPIEAGVISPELYGLDAVSVPLIHRADERTPRKGKAWKAGLRLSPRRRRPSRAAVRRIGRSTLHIAAVAAVTLLLYFAWATPVQLSPTHTGREANMAGSLVFSDARPTAQASGNAGSLAEKTIAVTESPVAARGTTNAATLTPAAGNAAKHEAAAQPEKTQQPGYTLVLASAVSMKNAQAYVARLKERGYADAAVYKRHKMVRVIFGHYASEPEAFKALKRLNGQEEFAEAWVLPLP